MVKAAGLFPFGRKHKKVFGHCGSLDEKIAVCKTLLKEAGMTGKPSLKKAEFLKLQKEACELKASATQFT